MVRWLPKLVARVRATIHVKLAAAFVVMVLLLVAAGAVGLRALAEVNQRVEEMVNLQRKIAAYRQLNHDTVSQLYSVAAALMKPEASKLDATLRQLNQFGYDLDRLHYVASDEKELLGRVRTDYEEFIGVVSQAIEHIRAGRVAQGVGMQLTQASPLADRLERLTNELVNKAESQMVASIETSHSAYTGSQKAVMAFGLVSIVVALVLGYAISWSVIGPVRAMEARTKEIAAGDFANSVQVDNRDELGALAADLNRMSGQLGQLYGQLAAANTQLEAASRHKSQFLANMSHELRTPLNAILGYTELIQDKIYGEVPKPIAEVLDRVQKSGRHLLGLINDVLDLSKIEAGQLKLAVSDYSASDVVHGVVGAVESLAAEKGLALTVKVAQNLPHAHGDERRISQVLLNLVGNAIKFTQKGEVAIRVDIANGEFEYSVTDTGPGIPADQCQRIFEEFQQVEGEGSKGGTGLGLAISRKIVQMHGGQIGVDSVVGEGSRFWFRVPVRVVASPHPNPPP
ncbi:MAG: ATP-binding protein [Burkholderiales bacterium]